MTQTINTNLISLNAQRHLSMSQTSLSTSMQRLLRQLVGLRHHRVASLLQDVGAAEVGGFRREVGIHDAAAGRALVFYRHL